jgi:hypothetical protein
MDAVELANYDRHVTVSVHPTSMTVLLRDSTYALDSRVAIVKVRASVDVLRAVRIRFARREVGYYRVRLEWCGLASL